jgi:hypothetical protein
VRAEEIAIPHSGDRYIADCVRHALCMDRSSYLVSVGYEVEIGMGAGSKTINALSGDHTASDMLLSLVHRIRMFDAKVLEALLPDESPVSLGRLGERRHGADVTTYGEFNLYFWVEPEQCEDMGYLRQVRGVKMPYTDQLRRIGDTLVTADSDALRRLSRRLWDTTEQWVRGTECGQ